MGAAALLLPEQAAPVSSPDCDTAVDRTDLSGDILAGEVKLCGSGLFLQDRN